MKADTKNMRIKYTWIYLIVMALFVSCSDPSLDELRKDELSSGKRYDELFLGLELGMKDKDFYDQCSDLNKQKIIEQGREGLSVQYELTFEDELKIHFNFYPVFEEGRAYTFTGSFQYEAWAPWNKELQSTELIKKIARLMDKWYDGNDFIRVEDDSRITFYKIDGNRQISMELAGDKLVRVLFTDLSYHKP